MSSHHRWRAVSNDAMRSRLHAAELSVVLTGPGCASGDSGPRRAPLPRLSEARELSAVLKSVQAVCLGYAALSDSSVSQFLQPISLFIKVYFIRLKHIFFYFGFDYIEYIFWTLDFALYWFLATALQYFSELCWTVPWGIQTKKNCF